MSFSFVFVPSSPFFLSEDLRVHDPYSKDDIKHIYSP
jgi:hypothetical protein